MSFEGHGARAQAAHEEAQPGPEGLEEERLADEGAEAGGGRQRDEVVRVVDVARLVGRRRDLEAEVESLKRGGAHDQRAAHVARDGRGRSYQVVQHQVVEAPGARVQRRQRPRPSLEADGPARAADVDGHALGPDPPAEAVAGLVQRDAWSTRAAAWPGSRPSSGPSGRRRRRRCARRRSASRTLVVVRRPVQVGAAGSCCSGRRARPRPLRCRRRWAPLVALALAVPSAGGGEPPQDRRSIVCVPASHVVVQLLMACVARRVDCWPVRDVGSNDTAIAAVSGTRREQVTVTPHAGSLPLRSSWDTIDPRTHLPRNHSVRGMSSTSTWRAAT